MADIRPIAAAVAAEHIHEPTLDVAGLRGAHAWMDPFLNIDHFVMREPTIRPHPHAGFSALTVMFDDSPGGFTNRDSLGTVMTIEPGALHWTQAGAGILHEEVPSDPPTPGHGAQIFVDLPADLEEAPPEVHHLPAAQVPTVVLPGDGGRVRVLVGRFADAEAPLRPPTDLFLLDLILAPDCEVVIPVAASHSAFAFALRGDAQSGPEGHESGLLPDHAVGFAEGDGDAVRIVTGADGLHALLGGGTPLRQPTHWLGGFALTTQARALAAKHRFESGQMGHLAPSF